MRSKLFLAAVVLAVVLVGMGVGRLILENRAMASEVADLEAQSEQVGAKNAEYLELVKRFQSDSFLEREARLKLNLQKPGEQAIAVKIADGTEASSTAATAKTDGGNLERWREYFFAPDSLKDDGSI